VLLANPLKHRHILGGLAGLHGRFDFRRDDFAPAQSDAALDDER
jgi:hypothetical protein